MAVSKLSGVKFSGVAACVPKSVEKITDYNGLDAEAAARFSKSTGILQRHVAPKGLTSSDMCLAAAEALIADLGWNKADISGIFYVSQSPDYLLPSTACILQDRLGLPKSTVALEISYGCSGYPYGIAVAGSMISALKLGKVLLLAGENTLLHQTPANTIYWPLFGDAGTATALELCDSAPDMFFDLCSDGSGKDVIIRRAGGMRNPFKAEDAEASVDLGGGAKMRPVDCYLDGSAIMDFCLREVKPSVLRVLGEAEKDVSQIDAFFAHQANKLINETVRKISKIPPEKTPYSIDEFGNTSVATIPLTMVTRWADKLKAGKSANLMSGFGVGFSWASAFIETDSIKVPALVEI